MKNESRKKKRIRGVALAGTAVVICAGAIFGVQARRNILNETKPYADQDTFRILEIVPTNENDANEEIGYFVSEDGITLTGQGKADFKDVSKAKSLGGRATANTDVDSEEYKQELQNLINMRNYGLLKYEGIDRGAYRVDISEHPVYSEYANFVSNYSDDYVSLGEQYERGYYVMNNNGSGAYYLQEPVDYSYRIEGDHYIYKVTETTVSDNSVSANTVSGDSVTYTTVEETERVEDGNENDKHLPEGIEVRTKDNGEREYTGNVDFVADENGKYYGYSTTTYYARKYATINNDFHNGEWFKEYVLGDRTSNKKITIDTIAAGDVTTNTLLNNGTSKYDLIYISGTHDMYVAQGTDLRDDVLLALYNMTALDPYQALIMDYALLGPSSGTNPSNIERLALMLWQADQKETISRFNEFTVGTGGTLTAVPAASSNVWSELGASMNELGGMANGNFVSGSVYVYDHKRAYFTDTKSRVDARDFFANGDFASAYTDSVVGSGFSNVMSYILMNNLNHADEMVSETITPAVVIQYILAYDGTIPSLVKTELNVLEIQPVRAFRYNLYVGSTAYDDLTDNTIKSNRDTFIKKFLDDSFVNSPNSVSFTSMTIEEFIGRNEDLNETYDLIYIGSNITHKLGNNTYTYYYTQNGNTKTVSLNKNGTFKTSTGTGTITDFKDNYMDGMVYYNVGDKYNVGTSASNTWDSLLGFIEDGSVCGDKNGSSEARFSGRDLTEDKKNQMIDYLNTGYPVIVAGDIMMTAPAGNTNVLIKTINPTTYSTATNDLSRSAYDHGRVDNSSKLYEFLYYAINGTVVEENGSTSVLGGEMKNLISEADVDNNLITKSEIADYLNRPKLMLNLTNKPVEYSYSTRNVNMTGVGDEPVIDSQAKLSPDPTTGKYYLDYEFTIRNAAALQSDSDTYGVHLYVDINADGKFSESEELADCSVTNAVTAADVSYTTGINGRVYNLRSNVLYKLRREVPEGFAGILPWSLEITMNGNDSIRASEIGYTQVPRTTTDKIKINILQVTKNSGTTLNLETQMNNPNGKYNYFGLYLSNLDDYDVTVKCITQSTYQTQYENAVRRGEDYFEGYDMLILGFADAYDPFTSETAVNGIISFMNSGKPVLLTHDLLLFRYAALQTRMLRNIVGMDRYGCMDDDILELRRTTRYTRSADRLIMERIEASGYRTLYMPGRAKESTDFQTQGITNLTMVRYRNTSENGNAARPYIMWNNIKNMGIGNWDDQQRFTVQNINEGQITTYPYILPDHFTVAQTHNQWFQLNMEADLDEDGETDIVVWYTLGNQAGSADDATGGGSRYWVTPNDVVNNYYIYNKGNITYSGVGHSTPANDAESKYEAQLFVNTMIAAYRAGMRVPAVRIYETDKVDSNELDSLVIAYDKNVGLNADSGDAQSSVLKDENGKFLNPFVNEGDDATKLYFQINDPNFVKGTKSIESKFYIDDPAGKDELEIDGVKVKVTEIRPAVYTSDFTSRVDTTDLQSGVRYGFYLPLQNLRTNAEIKLYVTAKTTISNVSVSNSIVKQESPTAITNFTVRKMDLLNLD